MLRPSGRGMTFADVGGKAPQLQRSYQEPWKPEYCDCPPPYSGYQTLASSRAGAW